VASSKYSPADEPFAEILDADEDTDGAPVHGQVLDGIYIPSRESLVCGEGREEEREPGAKESRVNMWCSGGRGKDEVSLPHEVEDESGDHDLIFLAWISV
jgi:hypothetical protein